MTVPAGVLMWLTIILTICVCKCGCRCVRMCLSACACMCAWVCMIRTCMFFFFFFFFFYIATYLGNYNSWSCIWCRYFLPTFPFFSIVVGCGISLSYFMIITFYKHRRAFALTFRMFRANVHVTIKLYIQYNWIQYTKKKKKHQTFSQLVVLTKQTEHRVEGGVS